MPVDRSSSSSTPRSGPLSRPMSLSRILRGPGISPSNEPSAASADSTLVHVNSPVSDPSTPRANRGDLPASNSPGDSDIENRTPRGSPNPFLLSSPVGTLAIPPSYQPFFDDGPLTSPTMDSRTGRNPRALRRHGAVALLVPQTPSASNVAARDSEFDGTGITMGPGSLDVGARV